MKSHKKLLSFILSVSTLLCCFTNLFVMASDIDVSNYTYVVDNMTFYKGETEIDSLDGATEVAVDVTKRASGGTTERLIISTYSNTGEYIEMCSVALHIDFGKTSTVKAPLNIPEGKTLGEVKAYVWKSFSSMTALSNALSSKSNIIIEPKVEYEELQTQFTDVAINDSFADAASFMAFLGIMNGYEDGTFRPTLNIRVADAAKLITYMTKGEDLASSLRNETLVADEIASLIEQGYINYCVKSKFLVPDENGYVNYNENITIKDFLILTLNALGYYPISNNPDSWQTYLNIATDFGFENLDEYDYSDYVTRGTAAEILAHAVNAPIVMFEKSPESDEYPVIQDGMYGTYYQTVLTKYFDLYTVEGYVTATSKDNMGLFPDEVNFGIAKSQKYIEEDLSYSNIITDYENITNSYDRIHLLKVGDTNAANCIGLYATAYLKLNSAYYWEIMRFISSSKNKIAEFDSSNLDKDDYRLTETGKYLRFFENESSLSTKYSLNDNVSVYVNGVKVAHDNAILDFVINGDTDKVTLVDTYRTDGRYDKIFVNSYVTAMVDTVLSNGKITFISDTIGVGTLTLDEEDDSIFFKIHLDGEELSVNDLKENDVLTIAYEVDPYLTDSDSFTNSNFYEISVSRNVITDTLEAMDEDKNTVKFGDKYYKFTIPAMYTLFSDAELGDDYTLYLDALGRIYKAEIVLAEPKYAIANKFIRTVLDDEYKLNIFTAEGDIKTYFFDSNKGIVKVNGVRVEGNQEEALGNLVYQSGSVKNPIKDRVIQYKVSSSSGKIVDVNFITAEAGNGDTATAYDAARNRIGAIRLSDSTKIIDACEYESEGILSSATIDALFDNVSYVAYAYGDKIDNAHQFVLITQGPTPYTVDTRFAVVTEDGYAIMDDEETGDTIYSIDAMYGDITELLVSDDVSISALASLKKGDVIYFTTNSSGYVENFDKIFSTGSGIPTQATLAANSLVANNTDYSNLLDITIPTTFNYNFSSDFTTRWTDVDADAIQVVYGPVLERTNDYITFGKIDSSLMTDINSGVAEFEFASDVNVYTYDYSLSAKYRFGYSGPAVSEIYPSHYTVLDDDTIDWKQAENHEAVTFAFAIVVEGEIVDILAFIPA